MCQLFGSLFKNTLVCYLHLYCFVPIEFAIYHVCACKRTANTKEKSACQQARADLVHCAAQRLRAEGNEAIISLKTQAMGTWLSRSYLVLLRFMPYGSTSELEGMVWTASSEQNGRKPHHPDLCWREQLRFSPPSFTPKPEAIIHLTTSSGCCENQLMFQKHDTDEKYLSKCY